MTNILDYNILVLYKTKTLKDKDVDDNILTYDEKPLYSIYPNMPLFKYGFYYYIHQTKNKTEIFEQPEIKSRDLHKIINQFEDYIPQDNLIKEYKTNKIKITDDIKNYSIKFFNSNRIVCRAFYKLWELLMMFELIPDNKKNINTLHLAEAPGSFVQAIIFYRKQFYREDIIRNDKYIALSIDEDNESSKIKSSEDVDNIDYQDNPDYHIPYFFRGLNKFKNFSIWSYKNSDITKIDIIDKLIKDYENSIDFITADGGLNWKDENFQEQEIYLLLLCEIYCALKCQKNNGNFVLKIFETFTELTVKLIEILRRFYKNVFISKPLLSRPSNSERYLICLNYYNDNYKFLNKLYNIIKDINNNTDKYLIDIFPNYSIPIHLDSIIKISSTSISNNQHKQINEMITYINNGNYYGDDYKKYLLKRKEANDFWITLFLPLNYNELLKSKKVINKMMEDNLKIVDEKIKLYNYNLT